MGLKKHLGFLLIALSFCFILPLGGISQAEIPVTDLVETTVCADKHPKVLAQLEKTALQSKTVIKAADPTLEEALESLRGGDLSAIPYVFEGLLALFTLLSGLLLKWFNVKWQLPSVALPIVVTAVISIGVVVSLGLTGAIPALLSVLSTSGLFGLFKGVAKFGQEKLSDKDQLVALRQKTQELEYKLEL